MTNQNREMPAAAVAALAAGNKIEAIKIVREAWGLGLKEAHDEVEAYVKSQPGLAAAVQESSARSQRGCAMWVLLLAALALAVYYFLRMR